MASTSVFAPLEPWIYHGPDVKRGGGTIDVGLLMEALIFYDRVYFGITSDRQFEALVLWFRSQGMVEELIALMSDGVLVPYYYAFVTLAGVVEGNWIVMNIQEQRQADGPAFEAAVLRSGTLEATTRKHSLRERIIDAALAHHVEVKADDFGSALRNAEADYSTADRASLLVQVLVDELYRDLGLVKPPQIAAQIERKDDVRLIRWGIDLGIFERSLGKTLAVAPGTPLAGAAFGTKALWTARQLGADLYVSAPMSDYLEYKIAEGSRETKSKLIVDSLVAEVAFPSVRKLANTNQIGFREVAELRTHSRRFRDWLRTESSLDRSAIVAYQEEIARASGWAKGLRRALSLSGVVAGAASGAALAGPLGAVGGAVAGEALKYVIDLAATFDDGWRPRVFGDWARARIDRALGERRSDT